MHEPRTPPSSGFLTFTLHAHLPYVVNHGTWPHGMEWLLEAAAETYLPLLRVLRHLERDHIRFQCNLDLSPVLLEQFAHPVFRVEFPRYLRRKMLAAQEDEAFFQQSGEGHYVYLAQMWHGFFAEALADFDALDGDLIAGFRHHLETGLIDIITCCATHSYLPLLGTDESIRAQIRTAVSTHHRHLGRAPSGIWLPECGYRPAGPWNYPVGNADGSTNPGFDRLGVEEIVREAGLSFFYVDTHLIEGSSPAHWPYAPATQQEAGALPLALERDVYRPYVVDGPRRTAGPPVSVFPRDPRTGVQVWSGELGYPGDFSYLDFHKKRWPGGHRYWRVTGAHVEMAHKEPYFPEAARERVREHASHFAHLVDQALRAEPHPGVTPILCAPFDAELFGHWWFEGATWLEEVARRVANNSGSPEGSPVELTSCREYLAGSPPQELIAMREGSWGADGGDGVWLNPETSWTYTHLYPAELYTRAVVTAGYWRETELGRAIVTQLCRELLLLESSDWQFLITTGAARDYAEARFLTHNDQFQELRSMWESFSTTGALADDRHHRLREITERDGIFPDLDPELWAALPAQPASGLSSGVAPSADATGHPGDRRSSPAATLRFVPSPDDGPAPERA